MRIYTVIAEVKDRGYQVTRVPRDTPHGAARAGAIRLAAQATAGKRGEVGPEEVEIIAVLDGQAVALLNVGKGVF